MEKKLIRQGEGGKFTSPPSMRNRVNGDWCTHIRSPIENWVMPFGQRKIMYCKTNNCLVKSHSVHGVTNSYKLWYILLNKKTYDQCTYGVLKLFGIFLQTARFLLNSLIVLSITIFSEAYLHYSSIACKEKRTDWILRIRYSLLVRKICYFLLNFDTWASLRSKVIEE